MPRHRIAELGDRTQGHQLGCRETRLTVPRPEAVISGPSWPQQLEMGRVPPSRNPGKGGNEGKTGGEYSMRGKPQSPEWAQDLGEENMYKLTLM